MTVSQEGFRTFYLGEASVVVFRRAERSGTPIPGTEFAKLAIGQKIETGGGVLDISLGREVRPGSSNPDPV